MIEIAIIAAGLFAQESPPANDEAMTQIERELADAPPSQAVEPDCNGPTREMVACMADQRDRALERMNAYLAEAIEVNARDPETVTRIRIAQSHFDAYREAECDAVAQPFASGGTVGPIVVLGCHTALIDQRTRTIWGGWLIPMADSEPPFLPEPMQTPME